MSRRQGGRRDDGPKGHWEWRNGRNGTRRLLVIIDRGKDPVTGKRKREHYTVKPNKKGDLATEQDADKLIGRKLAAIDDGAYVAPNRMKLAEYLHQWLAAKMRLSAKTRESYELWIDGRIIPVLGRIPLQDLTPQQIQSAWKQLLETDRKDGKGGDGLSPKTIHNLHGILRAALNTAVNQGVLKKNPCNGVELPKVEKQEMDVLDATQFTALLEAARGRRIFPAILLAGTVGLRRGECLALRWENVDLERRVLAVVEATEQTKTRGVKFKKPKSGKTRKVNLPAFLVEELRHYRAECGRIKGLVCCEPDGSVCSPTAITQEFGKLIRSLPDLPQIRFHDLRHSAATILLSRGVPMPMVSEILGHADCSITARVYAHVLPAMREAAAAAMDEALREATGG